MIKISSSRRGVADRPSDGAVHFGEPLTTSGQSKSMYLTDWNRLSCHMMCYSQLPSAFKEEPLSLTAGVHAMGHATFTGLQFLSTGSPPPHKHVQVITPGARTIRHVHSDAIYGSGLFKRPSSSCRPVKIRALGFPRFWSR
jgi:hypothetical protein